MKRNIKLLLSLLFGAVIMFTACEEDERPYGTDVDTATTIEIGISEDIWALPGDQTGDYIKHIYVKAKGSPVASDVTIPLVIDNVTLDPSMYTVAATSFVIPAGGNHASISITFDLDAMPLDVPYDFEYTIGTPSAYPLTEWVTGDIVIYKACPLNLDDFNGTFEMDNEGDIWTSTVATDPNVSGRIWVYEVWTGSDSCYLDIDDDGVISAENQFTMQHDVYGLGRVMFEDIWGSVTNTCVPIFEFNATPTLPDSGYWWGGEFNFKLTKLSSKIDRAESNLQNRGIPFKY